MKSKNDIEEFSKIFSLKLRKAFVAAVQETDMLQEIRLRAESPMLLKFRNGIQYLSKENSLCKEVWDAMIIRAGELRETMEYISNYSMYAYEEEIKRGYLTIAGGHRIGIAGKMLCENREVHGIKHISCLCIRLAHELIGCSDNIIGYLFENGEFADTLILSPPGFGKTTLLRDLIRNLSDGFGRMHAGYQVGVVDERSEIAACYLGVPQNNVGRNTDIYDSCPKETGITYLLRAMSPQIIAVDELSTEADLQAVTRAFGCGCRILATTHADSFQELQHKSQWNTILNHRFFRRYIEIVHDGNVTEYRILDENGQVIAVEGW